MNCGMGICLFPEVKRQWATLVLGWVTASVHYSCLIVNRNPFRPYFTLALNMELFYLLFIWNGG